MHARRLAPRRHRARCRDAEPDPHDQPRAIRCSSRRWRRSRARRAVRQRAADDRALLQARLDTLNDAERTVIERGAVEGKVFHRGAVTALAPEADRAGVGGSSLALMRKELVRPDRTQIAGDDAFRFRHLLIRDTAYDSLPKAVRAELHERFARWLAAHGDLLEQDELVGLPPRAGGGLPPRARPDDPRAARPRLAGGRLPGSGGPRSLRARDTSTAAGLLWRAYGSSSRRNRAPPVDPRAARGSQSDREPGRHVAVAGRSRIRRRGGSCARRRRPASTSTRSRMGAASPIASVC